MTVALVCPDQVWLDLEAARRRPDRRRLLKVVAVAGLRVVCVPHSDTHPPLRTRSLVGISLHRMTGHPPSRCRYVEVTED